jgi:hypothetical protein
MACRAPSVRAVLWSVALAVVGGAAGPPKGMAGIDSLLDAGAAHLVIFFVVARWTSPDR